MIHLSSNLIALTEPDAIAAALGVLIAKYPAFRLFHAAIGRRVRRILRWHQLPDIPEVRRLRAAWRKSWTFGAAPSAQELRALHQEALAAIIRALPDESAGDSN